MILCRVGLFYIINIGVVYGTFFYQTEKLITTKHCYEDYFGQGSRIRYLKANVI